MLSSLLKRCAPIAALALCACASQTADLTTAAVPAGEAVSRLPPPSALYQLSPAEMELDCKKLTGRMAVRIVQVRDYRTRSQATLVSRTIQDAQTSVMGGSKVGTDPDGRYARDLAQLQAYNARLASKDCPNFDLEASLDPNSNDPPRTRKANKS